MDGRELELELRTQPLEILTYESNLRRVGLNPTEEFRIVII